MFYLRAGSLSSEDMTIPSDSPLPYQETTMDKRMRNAFLPLLLTEAAFPASSKKSKAVGTPAPVEERKVTAGRNDPCPCGSGKKFKRCCKG